MDVIGIALDLCHQRRFRIQRARQHHRQRIGLVEIDHVRLRHPVAESHHGFVLHHELGHDRGRVRHQHVGGPLCGHHLLGLDEGGVGTGQRAVARKQLLAALGMQGQQPVAIAAGNIGRDLVMQVRCSAQPFGEGRAEQDHRPSLRRCPQCRTGPAIVAEQRVELRPAGLAHREVALARGQFLERCGGGRPLGAVEIEKTADAEMPARAVPLLHVEAMEDLHLGPGDERRHPVGRTEHRPRAQRQGLFQANAGHAGQLGPGRAILEPGRHRMPGGVQRLRQWGENRQRIALRRKQQVLSHHVLHDRSH